MGKEEGGGEKGERREERGERESGEGQGKRERTRKKGTRQGGTSHVLLMWLSPDGGSPALFLHYSVMIK